MIKQELKPYTIKSYKDGKKAVFRDGTEVRNIILLDESLPYPLFCSFLNKKGDVDWESYLPEGNFSEGSGEQDDPRDLMELPHKRECWFPLFNFNSCPSKYPWTVSVEGLESEDICNEKYGSSPDYVGAAKFEWYE